MSLDSGQSVRGVYVGTAATNVVVALAVGDDAEA